MKIIIVSLLGAFILVGCGKKQAESEALKLSQSVVEQNITENGTELPDCADLWITEEIGNFGYKIPQEWSVKSEPPNSIGYQQLMINNPDGSTSLMFINSPQFKNIPKESVPMAIDMLLTRLIAKGPMKGAKLKKREYNYWGISAISREAVRDNQSDSVFQAVGIETNDSILIVINSFSGDPAIETELIFNDFEYSGTKLREF